MADDPNHHPPAPDLPPEYARHRDRGYLPHWERAGAVYFVTFRLADAPPKHALEAMSAELRLLDTHARPTATTITRTTSTTTTVSSWLFRWRRMIQRGLASKLAHASRGNNGRGHSI
jgi:hypothetical protein